MKFEEQPNDDFEKLMEANIEQIEQNKKRIGKG